MDDPTLPSPRTEIPGDPEVDAFIGRLGRIAVAVAGGLVMALLGAGLASWLELGLE